MRSRIPIVILVAVLLLLTVPVRADIAPPDRPPGANLAPESENTQVRMVSERVAIELNEMIQEGSLGAAEVKATFTMQKMGDEIETMFVRFPLTFWNDSASSSNNFPEIIDVEFVVAGEPVDWQRVDIPVPDNEQITVPWAEF